MCRSGYCKLTGGIKDLIRLRELLLHIRSTLEEGPWVAGSDNTAPISLEKPTAERRKPLAAVAYLQMSVKNFSKVVPQRPDSSIPQGRNTKRAGSKALVFLSNRPWYSWRFRFSPTREVWAKVVGWSHAYRFDNVLTHCH